MTQIIIFPDSEAKIIEYLRTQLEARGENLPVGRWHTRSEPAERLRVSRIGGNARNLVTDSALIQIEIWASDLARGSQLAALTRALLLASPRTSDEVIRAEDVTGPALITPEGTDDPRHLFEVQLDFRGTASD